MAGPRLSSSINAEEESGKDKSNKHASQSRLTGSSLSSGATLGMCPFSEGGRYGINVPVGD